MTFQKLTIDGAFKIVPRKFEDDRGYFAREFCSMELQKQGIDFRPVQSNIGFNHHANTVRGMHYQGGEHAESKLVRCTRGALFDVIVDMRPESPSYLEWEGAELSEENTHMLYLPAGCAHGYQTLKNLTEINYMVSAFYHPDSEKGFLWNDPEINIRWPETDDVILSDKDRSWPPLKNNSQKKY